MAISFQEMFFDDHKISCSLILVSADSSFVCIKCFLCVSNCTPNAMVYGDCGWNPLYFDAYLRCIGYCLKITSDCSESVKKLQWVQIKAQGFKKNIVNKIK